MQYKIDDNQKQRPATVTGLKESIPPLTLENLEKEFSEQESESELDSGDEARNIEYLEYLNETMQQPDESTWWE